MNNKDKLICALDTSDFTQAISWAHLLETQIGIFKIGLELYCSMGNAILNTFHSGNKSVFLDLKFHDIPNTVARTVQTFTKYNNIKMLTVHATGEADMIRAAVNAAEQIDVIAVTLLTSLSSDNNLDIVEKRAEMALNAGAKGVVCSAYEVSHLRNKLGNNFKIIVPGVRLDKAQGGEQNDQVRTGHPKTIINDGADYLVIGRPITQSNDPLYSAKIFNNSLN